MTAAVLELRDVVKEYAGTPPVRALDGITLHVEEDELLAIVGPSGSGKSTLLNILGCLDRQTSGTYRFDGVDVSGLTDGQRAALRGSRIGFVFQSFHLLAHRSVVENVMLAEIYLRTSRRERKERALANLELVGLSHRAEYLPVKLSGGERQRVAVARALMGTPRLLLCDEPTGNLDSVNTASVLAVIDGLRAQGMTVLVITHEAFVAEHTDRAVRIIDGRLTEESHRAGTVPA